jgi:hypothetical protein
VSAFPRKPGHRDREDGQSHPTNGIGGSRQFVSKAALLSSRAAFYLVRG